MNLFQNLMKSWGPLAQGFMNNPYGNAQFQTEQQLGSGQARNLGQTATSGLVNNMTGSGMAGGASNPAATEMLQNQARANTGLQANLGFLAPTQAAQQRQFGAMNLSAGFRPFQTGQTATEKTSGLGTWLPQAAGAGLGLAGMFAGIPGGIPGMAPGQTAGGTSAGILQGFGGIPGGGMAPPNFGTSSFWGGGGTGQLPTGGFGGINMPPPPAPGGGSGPWGL